MVNICLGIVFIALFGLATNEPVEEYPITIQALTCFTKNNPNDRVFQYELKLTSKSGKKFTGTTFLLDENDPYRQGFSLSPDLTFEVYLNPIELRLKPSVCTQARLILGSNEIHINNRGYWWDIFVAAVTLIGAIVAL